MKKLFNVFIVFISLLFIGCFQEGKKEEVIDIDIDIAGSTWIILNNSGRYQIITFINEKIAYIINSSENSTRNKYENINAGTRIINGKKHYWYATSDWREKEWQIKYNMDEGKLTLDIPYLNLPIFYGSQELNPEDYSTNFSRRIIGNNNMQPLGIWTNESGGYFIFTNSDSLKNWVIGSYVSWDYSFDNEFITWSGNKDSGKKPYAIDNIKEELILILPGEDEMKTFTLVTNKFITVF